MSFKVPIYPQVWIVFIVWVAIILAVGRLQTGGEHMDIDEGLQSGIRLNVAAAAIFGLACVAFWKIWRQTGFTKVADDAAWWLLIIPGALIFLFAYFGLSHGTLASGAILILLVNSLVVGLNEEVMLRGLFFSGATNRFSFLNACIITTVLFGGMHLLNFFSTGEIKIVQAIATMFVGLIMLAIRVGMGSIIPAILVHGLWDFAAAATASVDDFSGEGLVVIIPLFLIAAPVLFGVTGGIYLWRYSRRLSTDGAG